MTTPIVVTCPYCSNNAEFVSGKEVYPQSQQYWGLYFWMCRPCGAWVGCHQYHAVYNPRRDVPFGTLADAPLRAARQRAHRSFDTLWKATASRSAPMNRKEAYAWLRTVMNLPADLCHISMMDAAQCEKVVSAVSAWLTSRSNERSAMHVP